MSGEVRLTQFSHGAGCGCKIGPGALARVLARLPASVLPQEVVVSQETGDDAAAYLLGDGRALIQTVDFFTPVVDDPYDWGRIAAANAVSDVYAMGGTPVLALNLVGWPVDELSLDLLARVLEGGSAVAALAGMAVVGGHSIDDREPKYGMAVTGFAQADRLVRNSTAKPGGVLYLSKPLGTGILSTAMKRGVATAEHRELAVATMTQLNDGASEAMVEAHVDAATDVTGFGLLGHLRTMLAASGCSGTIEAERVEVLPGVPALAGDGVVPGGSLRNHRFLDDHVAWGDLQRAEQLVLADAQTSGGLLMATREPERLERAFEDRGLPLWRVGTVHDGPPGRIVVSGRLRPA